MWAASAEGHPYQGFADAPLDLRGRADPLSEPHRVPGPGQARAAEERGAAVSLPNAAEYAVLLTLPGLEQPQAPSGPGKLSEPEPQLATLVAPASD
jgi:hypothetical protein